MDPVVHHVEEIEGQYAGCALTIGNFEGVHRGHQQILSVAARLAGRRGTAVVALTFEPHPLVLLRPQAAPEPLMPLDEKVRCLGRVGASAVVVARTTADLLAMTAESFVERVVCARFAPADVVEGESFGFGLGRRGGPALLRELAPRSGFEVSIVKPVQVELPGAGPTVVSSSLVRRLVAAGQVEGAAHCLGRPYTLLGVVSPGQGRGRTLGYPTINLGGVQQLLPGEGVYAGAAEVAGRRYSAAVSVGAAATFGEQAVRVEAHLLDCSADLYGRDVRLEFHSYLRGQQRFEGVDALRAQIGRDVEAVRRARHPAGGPCP
jgi:riboflavin kinase/FMN adenylyltransferase